VDSNRNLFSLANALLLNIPFYIHVLVYLPFVALARFFERASVGGSATTAVLSWRVPVIIFAIILGLAHTAQRLKGGGSSFLFVEGDSVVSLSVYVSLLLLALCAVLIALDLKLRIWDEIKAVRSRRGVPGDA